MRSQADIAPGWGSCTNPNRSSLSASTGIRLEISGSQTRNVLKMSRAAEAFINEGRDSLSC